MLKRILSTACAVILILSLAGCSMFKKEPAATPDDPSALSEPQHAVVVLLKGLQEADFEALKSSIVYPEEVINEDIESVANNALAKAAVKSLFKKLEYTVTDVQVSSDTATLTLDVTYPDLGPIITSNYNYFASKVGPQIADGTFDQAATRNEILWAVAADLVAGKAAGTQTETIEVTCQKVNDKWKIAPDRPILNVCTGNALNTLDTLDYTLLLSTT